MKKATVFLFCLALVFAAVGSSGAISFSDTQSVEEAIGDDPKGSFLLAGSDSEFPYEPLDGAALKISGDMDSDQNPATVSEEVVVNLTQNVLQSFFLSSITDLFLVDIPLSRAFNYTPNSPNGSDRRPNRPDRRSIPPDPISVTPVPEPSTMLFLGLGLVGLVAVGRRKFNRKE